jgi:hypothetical protein
MWHRLRFAHQGKQIPPVTLMRSRLSTADLGSVRLRNAEGVRNHADGYTLQPWQNFAVKIDRVKPAIVMPRNRGLTLFGDTRRAAP